MKITHFSISFNNPGRVFIAGEHISGKVNVSFAKPTKLRCVKLIIEGKAKSHWEVKQGKSRTNYTARESYINQTIILYGGMTDERTHPVGEFSYPFDFPLPPSIPSSYEGRRGYVRYFCKAVIDRPWKFDESIKTPFTAIHHLDCNLLVNALNLIYEHRNITIDGCCCEAGTVEVDMSINKTAYVPGEPLVYDITVNNQTDTSLSQLFLLLRQVSTFTGYSDSLFSSGKPHYHAKKEVFTLFNGPVHIKQNTTEKYNGATTIPALVPSVLEGCNIINIQYFIVLKIPCGWSTVKIEREIVIGSIPTREFPTQLPRPIQGSEMSPSQIEMSIQPTAPPSYSELPPSYAECVFGAVDVRDENDDEHTTLQGNWAPAYTYYNWDQHSYSGPQPQQMRPAPPAYDDC